MITFGATFHEGNHFPLVTLALNIYIIRLFILFISSGLFHTMCIRLGLCRWYECLNANSLSTPSTFAFLVQLYYSYPLFISKQPWNQNVRNPTLKSPCIPFNPPSKSKTAFFLPHSETPTSPPLARSPWPLPRPPHNTSASPSTDSTVGPTQPAIESRDAGYVPRIYQNRLVHHALRLWGDEDGSAGLLFVWVLLEIWEENPTVVPRRICRGMCRRDRGRILGARRRRLLRTVRELRWWGRCRQRKAGGRSWRMSGRGEHPGGDDGEMWEEWLWRRPGALEERVWKCRIEVRGSDEVMTGHSSVAEMSLNKFVSFSLYFWQEVPGSINRR